MIVLRTPKGWTGPKQVDGLPVEGTWRAHQVPLRQRPRGPRATCASSRSGCAPTGPRSCSTPTAPRSPSWRELAPAGERRMSANPHANGGLLLRELLLPDFREYGVEVKQPGARPGRGDGHARRPSCAT